MNTTTFIANQTLEVLNQVVTKVNVTRLELPVAEILENINCLEDYIPVVKIFGKTEEEPECEQELGEIAIQAGEEGLEKGTLFGEVHFEPGNPDATIFAQETAPFCEFEEIQTELAQELAPAITQALANAENNQIKEIEITVNGEEPEQALQIQATEINKKLLELHHALVQNGTNLKGINHETVEALITQLQELL